MEDKLNSQKYDYSILLIEDNKTNQFMVQLILEQSDYIVRIVENGQIGLEEFRLNQDKDDIILMDLHMSIMDGEEVSSKISEFNKTTTIIAMTADTVTGLDDKCKEFGINAYFKAF